jgi:hypothetical protein
LPISCRHFLSEFLSLPPDRIDAYAKLSPQTQCVPIGPSSPLPPT